MKIEQAIEILSSRNETNKLFCENLSTDKSKWSDYDKFISEDSQAAELALTALKEKQEREKNGKLVQRSKKITTLKRALELITKDAFAIYPQYSPDEIDKLAAKMYEHYIKRAREEQS